MRLDANMVEATEEETTEFTKPYSYFEQILIKKIQHFYISGDIEDSCKYIDMVHKIHTSSEHDTVHIHICSNGGDLSATLQIISAMKASPAHIICEIQSEAYSAATLIFLAADEFIVNPHSLMMIHDFSSESSGKSANHLSEISAEIVWFKKLSYDYYSPFLTHKEIEEVLKGSDLWIQTDDINRRLNKMVNAKK